jgi:hypothetical protein
LCQGGWPMGEVAGGQGLRVAAFRRGQLPLRPGLSETELGRRFTAYSRA